MFPTLYRWRAEMLRVVLLAGGALCAAAPEKACDLKINQKAVESTCRSAPGCACWVACGQHVPYMPGAAV